MLSISQRLLQPACHIFLHIHTRMALSLFRELSVLVALAGHRAWLQLSHMTSPFAPHHSLHLPSSGHTMNKECIKSVRACVCVLMPKCVNVATRRVSLSTSCLVSLRILCGCAPCVHREPDLPISLPTCPLLSSPTFFLHGF